MDNNRSSCQKSVVRDCRLELCTAAVVCRGYFLRGFLFLTVTDFSRFKVTVLLPNHFPVSMSLGCQ